MVYDIYIKNGKFVVKESNYHDEFDWLNKTVVYDGKRQTELIHSDESHIEYCKNKLLKELIEEQQDIIKKASEQLNVLKNLA